MVWEVAENIRCEVHAYTGTNCSGSRKVVDIFPSGREGDVRAEQMRSVELHAPLGVRFILMTRPGPDWEAHPWRAIVMTKAHSIEGDLGKPCIRVPHLELENDPGSWRFDPDFMESYPRAESLKDGSGWTFGRVGALDGQVRGIRIDRVG